MGDGERLSGACIIPCMMHACSLTEGFCNQLLYTWHAWQTMVPRAYDVLTPEQHARKDEEVAQQLMLRSKHQVPKWALVDKGVLEDSCPTHQDGLPKEKVALWQRQICTLLQKAGMNLKM